MVEDRKRFFFLSTPLYLITFIALVILNKNFFDNFHSDLTLPQYGFGFDVDATLFYTLGVACFLISNMHLSTTIKTDNQKYYVIIIVTFVIILLITMVQFINKQKEKFLNQYNNGNITYSMNKTHFIDVSNIQHKPLNPLMSTFGFIKKDGNVIPLKSKNIAFLSLQPFKVIFKKQNTFENEIFIVCHAKYIFPGNRDIQNDDIIVTYDSFRSLMYSIEDSLNQDRDEDKTDDLKHALAN